MKKKYIVIIMMLMLTFGCKMMGNTPTAKVEEVLKKYTNNTDVVKAELGDYLNTLNMNTTNREAYQDIYLRQYSDMTYEIKDEKIDGDNAVVTTQIKVYDYYTAENIVTNYINAHQQDFYDESGVYNEDSAYAYRLEELKKVKDRVEYTIEFTLTKVNGEWTIDNLSNDQLQKIHGTYAH